MQRAEVNSNGVRVWKVRVRVLAIEEENQSDCQGRGIHVTIRCLQINPFNTGALCHMGVIMHRDRRQNDIARQYFERCTAVDPSYTDAL